MDDPTGKPNPEPTHGDHERDDDDRLSRRQRVRSRKRRVPRVVRTNYLLHILFYDGRFRWALIASSLVFVALGLVLPKIWITSPKGFLPVIKVSGLDLLQAWSLRRAAARAEAGGHPTEAIRTWVGAVANDAANPDGVRGLLRTLTQMPLPDRTWLPVGLQQAGNLLRLTQTNLADLELATRFYARYDQHEFVIARLGATNAPVTPATAALLRALFLAGQMPRFGDAWKARESLLAGDPESALYHAAWRAGWGPAGESTAGRDRLEAALKTPALRPLALSLLLRVHYKALDLPAYERHLAELADLHADTTREHIWHWLLLDLSGRRKDAAALARVQNSPPQTPGDAEQLLVAWTRLGLFDEGAQFVRKQLAGFGPIPVLWVRAGQLLIEGKRWDDLRAAANDLRQMDRLKATLGNYGRFLEGVADHGLGRRLDAETAFAEFVPQLPKDPAVTFQAAVTLNRLGYPEPAAAVLKQLEVVAGNDLAFWKQVQLTAYEGRQAELLLAASERVHQLQPDDNNASNFAAALLMMRERPAEAVQLTLQVLNHAPQSRIARVNHALSLVQNGRLDEAEQLLKTVSTNDLTESARTVLAYVWFQCHRAAGRIAAARASAALVDVRHLFPPQVRWLEQAKAELPPG